MKTTRARRFLTIRRYVLCLTLIGMVAGAFGFGKALARRFGRTTAPQSTSGYAPNLDLGQLLAAGH
jgi:hypothetical protein